jgi:hypothetical protein
MYIEARDNISLIANGGHVSVVVQTELPEVLNFGLVLEESDGTPGAPITSNGTLGDIYLLGDAKVITGKTLVCYGRVVDPKQGNFELHCEFFQKGQLIKKSKSAAAKLTENSADFGVLCTFQ